MTKSETERLTRVEDKQTEMAETIAKMDKKLDALQTSFDSLNGGRRALIWFTATLITIAGIIIGALNLRNG